MYVPLHFAPCELLPGLSKLLAWPDLRPDLRALLDDQLIETADDVRGILGVPCWANNYAYGVELGVPWLHIDIRPRRAGKVLWFSP